MDSGADILVIILSVALAVFLILAIALMILLLRISRQIKHITDSAERTINSAENTMSKIGRFTSPALAGKMVMGLVTKQRKGGRNVKGK